MCLDPHSTNPGCLSPLFCWFSYRVSALAPGDPDRAGSLARRPWERMEDTGCVVSALGCDPHILFGALGPPAPAVEILSALAFPEGVLGFILLLCNGCWAEALAGAAFVLSLQVLCFRFPAKEH